MTPTVVLLAGASGVGKTRVAHRLAARLGAALAEVDHLLIAAQALTTPQSHPDLHFWATHSDAGLSPDDVVVGQLRVAEALAPAVAAVVADHLAEGTPVVLEGDYLVPTADRPGVRSCVVHEDDADQLVANYSAREPGAGEQRHRAECSVAHGRWLAARAAAVGVPVIAARPWTTVLDRVLTALDH